MENITKSEIPLISNGFVTCYKDYFIIHLYYFPFGNKKIKYNDIRSCELRSTDDLGLMGYKLWGMALSPIWWHCDMSRLGRKKYILLDAHQWPFIGLTMDDNELIDVYNLIRQKIYFDRTNHFSEKQSFHSSQ